MGTAAERADAYTVPPCLTASRHEHDHDTEGVSMVHLSIEPETMDKLAANACLHGRSLSAEIKARIEQSFKPERAEPREWR
jgi:hypothetical protein